MSDHFHVGFVEFLVTGLYLTIWNFLWRMLSMKNHDNSIGKAMSVIN